MAREIQGWVQQPDGSFIDPKGYHWVNKNGQTIVTTPDGSIAPPDYWAGAMPMEVSQVFYGGPGGTSSTPAAAPSPLASLAPHAAPQSATPDVPAAVAAQQEGFGKANQGGLPQPLAPGQQGPPQQPQGPTQGPTPFTYGLSGNLATPQPSATPQAAQPAVKLAPPPPVPPAPVPAPQGQTFMGGDQGKVQAFNVPGLNLQLNYAQPSQSEYYAYVQQIQNAGGTPQPFNTWQTQEAQNRLVTNAYNYYNQLYQGATGQDLSTRPDVRKLINQQIMGMAPAAFDKLQQIQRAAAGDQQALTQFYNVPMTMWFDYNYGQPPDPNDPMFKLTDGSGNDITPADPANNNLYQAALQRHDAAVAAIDGTTGARAQAMKDLRAQSGFLDTAVGNATGMNISQSGTGATVTMPKTVVQVEADAALARRDNVINQFESRLGRAPTADELNSLQNAPAQTLTDALANAPYKDGMTFKEYTDIQSQMDTAYLKYYGRAATPQEIAWGAGKSNDAIQSHLMQGDSRVQGINLGTYLNYANALNPISEQLYGNQADDHIIADFHQSLQAQGKDFTPTINPKGGS
jgi:hypothetical protein